MDIDQLKEALHEVLKEHRSLDEEQHRAHHDYIEAELQRRQNNKDRWNRFQSSFIGGLALAVLGFLGWVGTLILEWVKQGQATNEL